MRLMSKEGKSVIDENSTLEEVDAECNRIENLRKQKYIERNSFVTYFVSHRGGANHGCNWSIEEVQQIPGHSYQFEDKSEVANDPSRGLTPKEAFDKQEKSCRYHVDRTTGILNGFLEFKKEYEEINGPLV